MGRFMTSIVNVAGICLMVFAKNCTASEIAFGNAHDPVNFYVVANKLHPRTLPAVPYSAAILSSILDRVNNNSQIPLPLEPDVRIFDSINNNTDRERARVLQLVANMAYNEEERLLLAAVAWNATRDSTALWEVRRRVLNLADWAPRGASGFFFQDQAGRSIAWSLALAYDWLYEEWKPHERQKILDAIKPRVEDMLSKPVTGYPTGWAAIDWGRKLDRQPYDSHGVNTLARLAVICTALAGEDQLFDRCFKEVVPRYLARPIPWGAEDGGFAPGTAYAHWGVLDTHFVVWHLLKNALEVDFWQRAWAKGYLNYVAYFLPPATPSGLFGDAAERHFPSIWATQAKAYSAARPSPLADWYARQQHGDHPLHLALLLTPQRDLSRVSTHLPIGIPNAVHLADIGWVALHSDLNDLGRTSVYFKSSPYGSFNHSHADQNSFVIHAQGRALAIDSGYYDFYNSPHWRDWYKQTRAHNVVTFDGGKGQLHDTMEAKGKITRFEHHPDIDLVTGDATAAYGGALSQAVRSIIYFRPNSILVYDRLASITPRTWEWNLHSLSRMRVGGRELEIQQDGVRICVTMLNAPEGVFSQTDQFTVEPQGKYPEQWHVQFASQAKSLSTRFVSFLDVGCLKPEVYIFEIGEQLVFSIAGRHISLLDNGSVSLKK